MDTSGLRQNASHDQKCQVIKKQKQQPYTTFTLRLLCAFSYKRAPNPRQVKAPRRCQLRELQASCKDREPAIAAVSKSCKKAAAAAARVSSCKQAASYPRISPAIKKKKILSAELSEGKYLKLAEVCKAPSTALHATPRKQTNKKKNEYSSCDI